MKPEDHIKAAYLRAVAVEYAKHFIGTPYHWGGDSPMEGFDCSGLVVEVLQAVGKLAQGRDYTANDLFSIFRPGEVFLGYAGCLAFYLDPAGRAVHVVLMVDNSFAVGADGGGSATITLENAIKNNAYVKLRPLDYRKGPRVIIDPFKVTLP